MPILSEHVLKSVIPLSIGIFMAVYGAFGPRLGTSFMGNRSPEQLNRTPTRADRAFHIGLSVLIILYGAFHLWK